MDAYEKIDRFAESLRAATDLLGNDLGNVDPEYMRATTEFVCLASGLSGELAVDIEAIINHFV